MYEVWELPDTRLIETADRDDALHQLDAECRRRHEQAAAAAGDTSDATYRFDIRNADTGRAIAWLTWSPDTSRPYESVLVDEMLTKERS